MFPYRTHRLHIELPHIAPPYSGPLPPGLDMRCTETLNPIIVVSMFFSILLYNPYKTPYTPMQPPFTN